MNVRFYEHRWVVDITDKELDDAIAVTSKRLHDAKLECNTVAGILKDLQVRRTKVALREKGIEIGSTIVVHYLECDCKGVLCDIKPYGLVVRFFTKRGTLGKSLSTVELIYLPHVTKAESNVEAQKQ